MGKVNALWMDEHSEGDVDSWDVTGEAMAEAMVFQKDYMASIKAPVEAVPMVREMKVRMK